MATTAPGRFAQMMARPHVQQATATTAADLTPRRHRARLRIALCFLAGTWLAADSTFGQDANSSAPANQANSSAPANQAKIDVMAVVNGQPITRIQLADDCLLRFGEEVLESLVNRQLIGNECRRRGITITEEEIYQEITDVAAKWGLSADRYLQMLEEKRDIKPEKYGEFIWTSLSLRRLAAGEIQVSPDEIQQALESEIGGKVQVRMISLLSLERAQEVQALALQDPESFGRLAREYSEDKNSASTSGLIPPIRRYAGESEIEEVAFALAEGEVSRVIEVANQFIILRCERHLPATPITQQQEQVARQRIHDMLSEQKLSEAADRLFERLQEEVEVINVFNDPTLQNRMPGAAATVNGVPISVADVAEECIARYGVEILEGEINRVLLMQELERQGLAIVQQDIQAEIAQAADRMGYLNADGSPDVEGWLDYVTSEEGATLELYVRDAVWPSAALRKLVERSVEVTEADLQKAFEANFGARVEVLAIVLQDQRLAQRVWNMAMQNRTPQFFGELAHQYSTEPASQANYGRVPPIERHGGRQRLEDVAFQMESGEISELVNIGEHWIILMCLGQTEPIVTDPNDPEIREALFKDIYEKKLLLEMADRFSQIKESSSIDNFLAGTTQSPSGLRSDPSANTANDRVPFRSQAPIRR